MRSPVARRRRRRFWNRTQSFHKNNARPSQKHHSCVALWGQHSKTDNECSRQRIFGSERTTSDRTNVQLDRGLARSRVERRHNEQPSHCICPCCHTSSRCSSVAIHRCRSRSPEEGRQREYSQRVPVEYE